MGIIGSVAASFAQSKGVEEMVGIGGSGIGIGIGKGIDLETVDIGGSVCVDMVAVEGGGMKGIFVWIKEVAVVGVIWIPIFTLEA